MEKSGYFFRACECKSGLGERPSTYATQHPKNQYQNHDRPFYQDFRPALGLHCLNVKHPVVQVQTHFGTFRILFCCRMIQDLRIKAVVTGVQGVPKFIVKKNQPTQNQILAEEKAGKQSLLTPPTPLCQGESKTGGSLGGRVFGLFCEWL